MSTSKTLYLISLLPWTLLQTPSVSSVGTGHSAVSPIPPPSLSPYNPAEPVWRNPACARVCVRACVCAERQPRRVWKKTLKEEPRLAESEGWRGKRSKKAEQTRTRKRRERRWEKCDVSVVSVAVPVPKSVGTMTRWPASTRSSILAWSPDRRRCSNTHGQKGPQTVPARPTCAGWCLPLGRPTTAGVWHVSNRCTTGRRWTVPEQVQTQLWWLWPRSEFCSCVYFIHVQAAASQAMFSQPGETSEG